MKTNSNRKSKWDPEIVEVGKWFAQAPPNRDPEVKKWLAIRKRERPRIDPETAEVHWCYACVLDPYGVDGELPPLARLTGLDYFARRPGSDIWV